MKILNTSYTQHIIYVKHAQNIWPYNLTSYLIFVTKCHYLRHSWVFHRYDGVQKHKAQNLNSCKIQYTTSIISCFPWWLKDWQWLTATAPHDMSTITLPHPTILKRMETKFLMYDFYQSHTKVYHSHSTAKRKSSRWAIISCRPFQSGSGYYWKGV